MITVATAQELMAESRCLMQCIPIGYVWYSFAAALVNLSNGEPVSTDPKVLIREARCLEQCVPAGYVPYILLRLLEKIVVSQSCIMGGTTVPDDVTDAPPCAYAIYFQDDDSDPDNPVLSMYVWTVGANKWRLFAE